ncbi:MAG: hypothetical protein COB81_01885 [Flavobacteriaceae bacterium]|nr:MAG: hypothetical protein COB81_01885 [Flavobacteriaceae bacterium]
MILVLLELQRCLFLNLIYHKDFFYAYSIQKMEFPITETPFFVFMFFRTKEYKLLIFSRQ